MTDVICEVCWTTSWQPCAEGTKDAVSDGSTGGWMQCGFCTLQNAYVALTERVAALTAALAETERLAFGIQRTVASDPENTWCRQAIIIAKELHDTVRATALRPPLPRQSEPPRRNHPG